MPDGERCADDATRRVARSWQAIVLLALLAATAACQGTPVTPGSGGPTTATAGAAGTSVAGPAASAGTTGGSPVADVISMTLAAGWQRVELTEAGLQKLVATVGSTNPQLTAALNQILTSGQYRTLLFYALGYDGSAYLGSVNVAAFAAALDLDGLAPVMESQFKSVGATGVTVTHVSLPGGPALRITYAVTVKAPTSVTVSGRAYVFVAGGEAYQVTFSCNGPDPAACLGESDGMIQTFRIGS